MKRPTVKTSEMSLGMEEKHSVASGDSNAPEEQGSQLARLCSLGLCEFSSCAVSRYRPRVAQQTDPTKDHDVLCWPLLLAMCREAA
jgi:hypothetical protein